MICPHIVNVSLLLGVILSWGLMWPLIQNHQGDWYPAGLSSTNFKGLYGYKVCKTLHFLLSCCSYDHWTSTLLENEWINNRSGCQTEDCLGGTNPEKKICRSSLQSL
jgi:hypothetical protein